MWRLLFVSIVGALSFTFIYYFYLLINYDGRPYISDDFCWGKEENCRNDTKVYPFKINIKQVEIDDLISRLDDTREFAPPLEDTQTQYGLNGKVLETLCKFVREEYNFTERQIFLNRYPQFTTNIQGIKIHFVHIKSKNERKLPVIPILLLHGWPSSVREFYDSIPLFMSEDDRKKAIDLVIPSLVGYGYSDGQSKPGFRTSHLATMMKILMNRLGYQQFLVHGSDWGAVIASNIATLYPEKLLGFHSNFCFSLRVVTLFKILLGELYPSVFFEKPYVNKLYPLGEFLRFVMAEAAYMHLMGTKPDTIGHVLDNTPIGLIAFMFEKYSVGTNKNYIYSPTARLENFDLMEIMDSILFYYWFPKKATTAARIYCENLKVDGLLEGVHNVPVDSSVPCACAMFDNEFLFMPESFLRDKYTNLVQYNVYPGIGHFAAIEANDLLTKDIISFAANFGNEL